MVTVRVRPSAVLDDVRPVRACRAEDEEVGPVGVVGVHPPQDAVVGLVVGQAAHDGAVYGTGVGEQFPAVLAEGLMRMRER